MRNAIVTVGGWRRGGTLLFADPWKKAGKVFLDGFETRPGRRCRDIVRPRNAALATVLGPGFLFPAEVALNPGNGDQSPQSGPSEGKRPAKLRK